MKIHQRTIAPPVATEAATPAIMVLQVNIIKTCLMEAFRFKSKNWFILLNPTFSHVWIVSNFLCAVFKGSASFGRSRDFR